MFRIAQRDHLALARFADQQLAARSEHEHARAVNVVGENRDVKSRRCFQSRKIERGYFGVSQVAEGEEREQKWKGKPQPLRIEWLRPMWSRGELGKAESLHKWVDDSGAASVLLFFGRFSMATPVYAVFISAAAKITAGRLRSVRGNQIQYI